jgi:predicted transcriptional regulator
MHERGAATITDSMRQRVVAIDEQLAQIDSLRDERARLVAAIAALDGSAGQAEADSPTRASESRPARSRRKRAAHGQVQTAVLGYLAENPGSSASGIAEAVRHKPNSVSTTLTQLAKAGVIQRSKPRGYQLSA